MEHKDIVRKFMAVVFITCFTFIFSAGCSDSKQNALKNENAGKKGEFHLVGTGPGDPDLLTARALEVIGNADMVICNSDEKSRFSGLIDFTNKKVVTGYAQLAGFYGKDCKDLSGTDRTECEKNHKRQNELISLLRKALSEGKRVAMLSNGDPTIFGPDVWVMQGLHDLNPVIVPGLSSFNTANAILKVNLGEIIITAPLTGKDHTDTIENLAGHEEATIVVFMPGDLKALFKRMSNIFAPGTPAAIVCRAGVSGSQSTALGTVGGFAGDIPAGIDPELSIVYVGKDLAESKFKPEKTASGSQGKFYLVGIGPGDPDLATLRALNVIEKSDLIFANQRISDKFEKYLTGKEVLNGYYRLFPFYGQECANVTRAQKNRERMSCEEYHRKQEEFAAIVREAVAAGKTVSMLDNGDPLVYGPCSWTLTELTDLETEVVPGVSCFNAANAALRVGVTEGEKTHSVILASGWSVEEMAVHNSAMVLFTMRTEFKKFIDSLSKHYSSDTPMAIVFSAGYAQKENVMHGTLGSILGQLEGKDKPFEYLLYIGDFLKKSVDNLNNE
ncbi:MAG: SAM-dependent methyltransferase [Desulfobacteraceae bacterium]|jgi:precorrin-4 methylase